MTSNPLHLSTPDYGTVFSEETQVELRKLADLVATLAGPCIGLGVEKDRATYDASARIIRLGSADALPRSSVVQLLREVGTELSSTVRRLESAMDEHFVRFFDFLRKKADQELAAWIPKPDAVTPESAGIPRALGQREGRYPGSGPTTTVAKGTTTTGSAAQNHTSPAGVESLQSWLTIALESTLTTTHATRGAVYLRSADSTGYLRRVHAIPSSGCDLPSDVALASGTTIGTVVQTGVGVTVSRSREDVLAEANTRGMAVHTAAQALRVTTAIVLPLTVPSSPIPIGGVIVADKRDPTQATFTAADEHRVWAFCAAAEGALHRYPPQALLAAPPSAMRELVGPLRALSRIAPVSERVENAPIMANGAPIPTRAKKMLVLRQGTVLASLLSKELHMADSAAAAAATTAAVANIVQNGVGLSTGTGNGRPAEDELQQQQHESSPTPPQQPMVPAGVVATRDRTLLERITPEAEAEAYASRTIDIGMGPRPLNDEDVLESVAPYIGNVEMLWHEALETVMRLRSEVERWEGKVGEKDARIVDLEVAMKNLAKQLHRTKADVRRIRRVVPQHLKEQLGDSAPADESTPPAGGAALVATAPLPMAPAHGTRGGAALGGLPLLPPPPRAPPSYDGATRSYNPAGSGARPGQPSSSSRRERRMPSTAR